MLARRLLIAAFGGGSFTAGDMTTLGITSLKDYGALGDGSHDDTSAIQAAVDAVNSAGRGVLWVPPGDYLTTGLHTISVPCTVLGMGGGGGKTLNYEGGGLDVGFVSRIICTSSSNRLFGVSSSKVDFRSLGLANHETGPTGALIETLAGGGDHAIYDDLTLDIQGKGLKSHYGREWKFLANWVYNAQLDIENLDAADELEATIALNHFVCNDWNAAYVIGLFQGGGLAIVDNTSVALGPSNLTSPTVFFKIDLAAATSNIQFLRNRVENYTDSAIYKTNANDINYIAVADCEFNGGRSGNKNDVVIQHALDAMIHDNVHVGNGQSYNPVALTNVTGGRIHDNRWRGFDGSIVAYFTGGTSIVAHDN